MYYHSQKKSASKTQRGFSIVEMMVAVTILVIAVGAPLTLIVQSIKLARFSGNRIQAQYFAEEAVEYMKYRRNQNVIKRVGFLNGFSGCIDDDCLIDVYRNIASASACNGAGGCPAISYFETDECDALQTASEAPGCERRYGIFGNPNATPPPVPGQPTDFPGVNPRSGPYGNNASGETNEGTTIFRRAVTISPLRDNNNEATVEVRVWWTEEGDTQELIIRDILKSFGCPGTGDGTVC